MKDFERLRSSARHRQHRLVRVEADAAQSALLLALVDEVYNMSSLGQMASRVLELCEEATGADAAVALLAEADGRMLAVADARQSPTSRPSWPGAANVLSVPRNVFDIAALSWASDVPADFRGYRSMLSVPVVLSIGPPFALVLFSSLRAHFTRRDRTLMKRVVKLIGPMAERIRLAYRDTRLSPAVSPFKEAPQEAGQGEPHATFASLTMLMSEVKRWQTGIFDITNAILAARSDAVDAAISSALRLTGELALADRTYVILRREPDRLDNTHEWVADGIAPMIEHLQDMPEDLLDEWRPALMEGQEVHLSSIGALPADSPVKEILEAKDIKSLLALPILYDGQLLGFVGYDSVRRHRSFLGFEIQLLRSVADAISVVLVRRAAERQAASRGRVVEYQNEVLKATLAAIPQLILEVGPDGRFIGFNEGSSMRPVYAPEDFIGKLPEEVLPPKAARVWWEAIAQVRETGECREVPLTVEVDGAERHYLISGGRLDSDGDEPVCIFLAREVTEERRLNRERVQLAKIAELTSSHVLILDAAGRVEWFNPAFAGRMGVTLESVAGGDGIALLGVMTSDPRPALRLRSALRAGQSIQTLLKQHDATGAVFWTALDMQAIRAEGGDLEGFVLVQSEVTGLKQSEEAALRERAMALEIATDGFAVADAEGMFTYMNAAHRAMFGIAPDEDIGGMSWRDLYTPEVAAEIARSVMPVLQEAGHWRGRLTARHRNGAEVPQQVALSLMEGGRILCATRDISAEIAWNLERARLSDDLQVAQRAQSMARVASEAAHDINNMIGVVRGTAVSLRLLCSGRSDALEAVARIQRATEVARNSVANLQSLERAPGPKGIHDLRAIVGDALVILGPDRIHAHQIASRLPEPEQPVYCASIDVLQVMMNLIWNACESKAGGTSRVRIEVLEHAEQEADHGALMVGGLQPATPYTMFRVTDDGGLFRVLCGWAGSPSCEAPTRCCGVG